MSLETYQYPDLIKKLSPEIIRIFEVFINNSINISKSQDTIRLVGGCVRDLILGRQINDFDFATKFKPEQIIQILEENNIKAVPTGIEFGTITAVINHKNFEITTLRKDNETNGRHCIPEFVDDYYLDAIRRDFTINAFYLDLEGNLYDYCNGIGDLKESQVRFIGDAETRLSEDYLRILRFFRFSCFYAKEFDEIGLAACKKLKKHLKELSSERIRNELFKIFSCPDNDKLFKTLQTFEELGIRAELFNYKFNFERLKHYFFLEQNLSVINFDHCSCYNSNLAFKNNYLFKFLVLILDPIERIDFKEIYSRLSFTRKEQLYCNFLLLNFKKYSALLTTEQLKILLASEDKDLIFDLYLLNLINNLILNKAYFYELEHNFALIKEFNLPELPINGNDLIEFGYKGKEIGKALNSVREFWAKSDFKAVREEILEYLNGIPR